MGFKGYHQGKSIYLWNGKAWGHDIVSPFVPLVGPGMDGAPWIDIGVLGTPATPLLRVLNEENRGKGGVDEWPIVSAAPIYPDNITVELSGGELQVKYSDFGQNLTLADGKHIAVDKVQARDDGGLMLCEDGGTGILIEDATGNIGIGTATPKVVTAGYSYPAGKHLNITEATNYARLIVRGTIAGAAVDWIDLAGDPDDKWIQFLADGGVGAFKSLTDAGALRKNNILVLDMGTGFVGMGAAPSYKLSIGSADNSDQIGIYHDNIDAFLKWTDGVLNLITDEGTNANTEIYVQGKGTGRAYLRVYDEDNEYILLYCVSGYGYISTEGPAAGDLRLQYDVNGNVTIFENAASGETGTLQISGYRAGDAKRTLSIAVGSDAADTASFAGLSNYRFSGNLVLADAKNIILQTTTGTKIGTATNQKLGFFNATPVVQQAYTAVSDPPTQAQVTAIRNALVNLGLMASS